MVDRQNCNSNKMHCITCSRVVIIIRIVHTVHILSFSIMYQSAAAAAAAGNGSNQLSINSSLTADSKVEPELGTRVRRPSSERVPSTDGCPHVSCHKPHCVALSLNASPCHADNDDKALRTFTIK